MIKILSFVLLAALILGGVALYRRKRTAVSDAAPSPAPAGRRAEVPPAAAPSADFVELDEPTAVDALSRLALLEDWPEEDLLRLALECKPRALRAGARVFSEGQAATETYFLLEGMLEFSLSGETKQRLDESDEWARYPIGLADRYPMTAIAATDVLLQPVPLQALYAVRPAQPKKRVALDFGQRPLPPALAGSALFRVFRHSFEEGSIKIPPLPAVALKLRAALRDPQLALDEAVRIVQMDPAIAAKLVHAANSALFSSASPVETCHAALSRLGVKAASNLVYSLAMKQLFHAGDPRLDATMREVWRESVYVSAMAYVLAEKTGKVDPDKALLAGLIHRIGAIPFLDFVARLPKESVDLAEIEAALPLLQAPVGARVLSDWEFPAEYRELPFLADDWFAGMDTEFGLADTLRLAVWHARLGKPSVPPIAILPAFAKLDKAALTPEFSLGLLREGKERIAGIQQMLAN